MVDKATSTSAGSLAGMGLGAAFGGPLGAMVGSSAGGLIGGMFGGDDEAMNILKKAQAAIAAIPVPTAKDLQLILAPLVQQGILAPEDYTTILQKPSAFTDMDLDQAPRNAEMAALSQIQDIASQGGNDASFRSAMNDVTNKTNTQMQGQSGAILQNAAERGALNSNMTTAAQLANAYSGNANASNAGVDAAAAAEQRALQAIAASGQLGGQVANQDFAQAQQKAQAIDAINRYNAQNTQSQANMNVQSRNLAQAGNLDMRNSFEQANRGIQNDQARYNAALPQQQFQNQLAKAAAMNGVSVPMANLAQQNSQNQAATQGNLIGGLGQGLSSYYQNQNMLNAMRGMQPQSPTSNFPATQSGNSWNPAFASGGVVPGRAPLPGDHPANDTVHARLSPGEVVVPRTATQSPIKLAEFVAGLKGQGQENRIHPEDVRTVLAALTAMRGGMWKGGYC